MAELDAYLKLIKEKNASDLHLRVGSPPLMRLHGDLLPAKESDAPLTQARALALIEEIMLREQKDAWHAKYDLDFSYEILGVARFRVNAFFTRMGPAAALRLIPYEIKSLEALGLPGQILKFADYRKGMLLVTGATGSGKSTTLATLVDYINRGRKEHILTIEDPIEFVHENKGCLVTQREVGQHTHSFAIALRAALREDPDVILVGELRDLETIELALTAAETGHLVLSTVHTNSASDTIDRIINVFPEAQQQQVRQVASNVLIGVVAQNLLKRKDIYGRCVATEIMVCTAAISNLIREGKSHQIPSSIQTGRKEGMETMDQSLMRLLQAGKVHPEEAYQFAQQKEPFIPVLAKEGAGSPPAHPHKK
jgi:twitching motility protein PilT